MKRTVSRLTDIRYLLGAVAAVALLAAPFSLASFQTFELTYVGVYAIAIMGLNILTGYSGQVSLGHGAFMVVGAYTTAIGLHFLQVPYWVTIPAGGLAAGLFGYLLGFPALRLSGLYLALATFALAVAMPTLLKFQLASRFTGGVKGIVLPPVDPPFAIPGVESEQWLYLVTLAIAAFLFWVAWNLNRSKTGRAFRALRDSELAAVSSGVNLARYKTLAFGISAFYAGVAGSLFALATAFVSPDGYDLPLSLAILIGAVVGGLGSLLGPALGAVFVEFLPILAQQGLGSLGATGKQLANAAPDVSYGILLILIMLAAPGGITGLVRSSYAALRKRAGVSLATAAQTHL